MGPINGWPIKPTGGDSQAVLNNARVGADFGMIIPLLLSTNAANARDLCM